MPETHLKSDSKKNSYSYGWSFYFEALSFIFIAEDGRGAGRAHVYRPAQTAAGPGFRATDYLQASAITRIPSYRYRYQRHLRQLALHRALTLRDASPWASRASTPCGSTEISMYTLGRDPTKAATTPTATYNSDRDNSFLQVHNCIRKRTKTLSAPTQPTAGPPRMKPTGGVASTAQSREEGAARRMGQG